jgi:hypothetical protein
LVQRQVFSVVTHDYHTDPHFTQNSKNDVARSLRMMTVFLAYALPFSPLSLLTILQVEIPGQDHDGYDTEPNFFHEMHQVRATAYPSFLSHIVHHSILTFLGHDLSSALGASKGSSSL